MRISDSGFNVQEFYGANHIDKISKFSDIVQDRYSIGRYQEQNWSLIPSNVDDRRRMHHLILVEAVRIAGLLHDIGHPPFSHITEQALVQEIDRLPDFMRSKICKGRALHEQMGLEISEHVLSSCTQNAVEYKEIKVIISIIALGILSDGEFMESRGCKDRQVALFCQDLHSIMDSSFDSDRLDYVVRDALNSGRDKRIEYNRIIQNMKLCRNCPDCSDVRFRFCPSIKILNSIEEVLFARYDGYVFVAYHHHAVKTNFILSEVIRGLIQMNRDSVPHDIEIPGNITGLWWPMADNLTQLQKSFVLCQWNDSWLLTMIKKMYFKSLGTGELDKMPAMLRLCLTELVTSRKCIYTLIKRKEHYRIIDRRVCSALVSDDIRAVLDRIPSANDDDITVLLKSLCRSSDNLGGGFITVTIRDILKAMPGYKNEYESYCSIPKGLERTHSNLRVVMNGISSGVSRSRPIFVYDESGESHSFDRYSNIGKSLEMEIRGLPWFYLFSDEDMGGCLEEVLMAVGDEIGSRIHDQVFKLIERKAI